MLSIIISSYQPRYFNALEKNIAKTIGVPYEIIKIDNPGIIGICEAYNRGAATAKFENLLFVHEDVEFETQNWGRLLLTSLTDKRVGCVGIAGSDYTPNCPFAWWESSENDFRNMIQSSKTKQIVREDYLEDDKKVTNLDGVFIACRREVFTQYQFDEEIEGFHGYDLNFSVRIANKYRNIVTSKIMLKHFSEGTKDKKWMTSLIDCRTTFKKPDIQSINKKKEAFFFLQYMAYLKDFNFSRTERRKFLLPYISPRHIGWKLSFTTLYQTLFK